MNIDKAIEINQTTLHQYEKQLLSGQRDALKLGIEALKRTETNRHTFTPSISEPLPGETKE